MPSSTPALTVVDAGNAALAAARILGLSSKELMSKNRKFITDMKASF